MTQALHARCPAKINLALRVLGRRPDGYHELDTVFHAIDLWDEIEASPAEEIVFACESPDVPSDSTNLVPRAAELLKQRAGRNAGARLRLLKRIPVGGGLGGGSSNAAATLLLLDRLWSLGLGPRGLAEVAVQLGADVPFFLHGGCARGRGVGERLDPLEPPPTLSLLLGVPPFGIATAEVYRRHAAQLTLAGNNVSFSRFLTQRGQPFDPFARAVNDLETVVFEERPELRHFKQALVEAGARVALLSGSGSTVFGVFDAGTDLDDARNSLAPRFGGWRLVKTRTVRCGVVVSERD